MHFTLPLIVLPVAVSASPFITRATTGRFSVTQKATGRPTRLAQVAHRRTYLKYGVAVPEYIHIAAENAVAASTNVKAAGYGATGTEAATPYQFDAEYLSAVNVGGTELMLSVDSGSSELWCFSSLLTSADQAGHSVYTTNDTNKLQGASWNIQYGDGSGAAGVVYMGTVEFGGVTATSQAIEAATSVSSQFMGDHNADGIIGFAFPSLNQVRPVAQSPFFDSIKGQLASPVFTASIKHNAPGSYDFGFIDPNKYTGVLSYVDVDSSNGFWQFAGDGFAVGSSDVVTITFSAILDTGSSLFYMPAAATNAYWGTVPSATHDQSAGGYTFDCSETLPDFTVVIGGKPITVPGKLLNYATLSQTTCFGGLQDTAGLPYNIFGDVFLKAVYAVFDTNGPRIGLAKQASGSSSGRKSSVSTPAAVPATSATSTTSSVIFPYQTGTAGGFGSGTGNADMPPATGNYGHHPHHHNHPHDSYSSTEAPASVPDSSTDSQSLANVVAALAALLGLGH